MREALGVLHEAAREDVPAQLSVGEDSDSRPRLKRDRLVDGAILDRLEVGWRAPASRRRRASSKAGGRSNEPTFSARTAFTVPARSLPSRLGHGGLAAASRPELLTRPRKRIMIHRTTRRTPGGVRALNRYGGGDGNEVLEEGFPRRGGRHRRLHRGGDSGDCTEGADGALPGRGLHHPATLKVLAFDRTARSPRRGTASPT